MAKVKHQFAVSSDMSLILKNDFDFINLGNDCMGFDTRGPAYWKQTRKVLNKVLSVWKDYPFVIIGIVTHYDDGQDMLNRLRTRLAATRTKLRDAGESFDKFKIYAKIVIREHRGHKYEIVYLQRSTPLSVQAENLSKKREPLPGGNTSDD